MEVLKTKRNQVTQTSKFQTKLEHKVQMNPHKLAPNPGNFVATTQLEILVKAVQSENESSELLSLAPFVLAIGSGKQNLQRALYREGSMSS